MTNEQVAQALNWLGFPSGWVVVGGEIIIWENPEKQPTDKQLKAAYAESELAREKAKEALLAKLGITAEEAALLTQ